MHPVISYSNERIEIYLAEGVVSEGRRALDEGEFLEVFTVGLSQALEWLEQGLITDTKTVIGLLWLDRLRMRRA